MADDDKIEIPKDFPGEPPVDPSIGKDPEVIAAQKENILLHLKLERYKDMAKAVGVILQTFKAEAVSLMSGLGTLVVGWFQLKKWVIQGRHETKAISQQEMVSTKTKTTHRKPVSSVSQGYGSGSGRLGSRHQEPVGMAPPPSGELVPTSTPNIPENLQTVFTDPMSYVPVLTALVFIWSSWKAWMKRKAKQSEGGK
jgi:hypothetical protein